MGDSATAITMPHRGRAETLGSTRVSSLAKVEVCVDAPSRGISRATISKMVRFGTKVHNSSAAVHHFVASTAEIDSGTPYDAKCLSITY